MFGAAGMKRAAYPGAWTVSTGHERRLAKQRPSHIRSRVQCQTTSSTAQWNVPLTAVRFALRALHLCCSVSLRLLNSSLCSSCHQRGVKHMAGARRSSNRMTSRWLRSSTAAASSTSSAICFKRAMLLRQALTSSTCSQLSGSAFSWELAICCLKAFSFDWSAYEQAALVVNNEFCASLVSPLKALARSHRRHQERSVP